MLNQVTFYKITIKANNPAIIGNDSSNNLNINPIPTANAGGKSISLW